jgi:signal transduction histidine kinase
MPPGDATPDVASAILARDLVSPVGGLELRDIHGAMQGHAGSLPRQSGNEAGLRRIQLRDGRLLLVDVQRGPLLLSHLHGLVVVVWIALVVAVATYPLARRLTRRLEALAATVDRFGDGDLSVRAPTDGQDEVAALAQRFNRMADRVAQLLKAHSRMLANASHELRSPLARMRLALELQDSTPTQAWLDGMRRDCAEIDQQIEEILLASKLEALGTFPPLEPLDLAALLAEECSRLNIPFELVPAPMSGNARLLRRLIRNLLDNAIKYGGSEVEARLSIAADGRRSLQVSDRGPGIPPPEHERIFEPFYRPAGASETGSGWGLGLSLVKQIAEHHGGRVECRDRVGGGCVFEASFPASQSG